MKIKKIKFNKVRGFLAKLPRVLGKRAFLTFLGLLVVFLIFSAFLFYKYIFLIEKIQPEITEKPLQFDEKGIQEILKKFEEVEKELKETEFKQYPDPFTRVSPIEKTPEEEELTE